MIIQSLLDQTKDIRRSKSFKKNPLVKYWPLLAGCIVMGILTQAIAYNQKTEQSIQILQQTESQDNQSAEIEQEGSSPAQQDTNHNEDQQLQPDESDQDEEDVLTTFLEVFILVFWSEIGDKVSVTFDCQTFFLVMMFTQKTNFFITFILGTIAMSFLHVTSAAFGAVFPLLIGPMLLKFIAIGIFFIYGFSFAYDAWKGEEEEVVDEGKKGDNEEGDYQEMDGDQTQQKTACEKFYSNRYIQFMFGMILAEMGDRSQITAIAMAANYGLVLVIVGGIVVSFNIFHSQAHAAAIIVAIAIGKLLEEICSKRLIDAFGSVCFFAFAIYELVFEDYYQILDLPRTANQEDIAKAFRRLSLRHHPMKNPTDMATNSYRFSEICEAYEVLAESKLHQLKFLANRKALYDQYGEEMLKEGIPDGKGKFKGGYKFGGNTFEIFEKFFGSANPFTDNFDDDGKDLYGSMFGGAIGGLNQKQEGDPEDVVVVLACTLAEFYQGCMKSFEYVKDQLQLDGKTIQNIAQEKKIQIKPGYGKQTVLRFAGEGNDSVARKTSDLVVKFQEVGQDQYKRNGNDLIYTHTVSLIDALKSEPAIFVSQEKVIDQQETLDNRTIQVPFDEVISPQTVKQVSGEGFPIISDDPLAPLKPVTEKGDLYIKFNITFPKRLSNEEKNTLEGVLGDK